jgi:predicted enzyme related to lactoylglutathione lyase
MTVTTMNPPGTFSWIELGTTDGPGAKEFYTRLFGWDVKESPMGPDFTYYMFQAGGLDVAAMYQLMDDQLKQGVPAHWMSYIAVASADEAAAKATSLGGSIISPPFDVGTHGRMVLMKDPQGAHFAVWQAGDHDGIGKRGEPGSLVWNELSTTDIKAGGEFYSKLFGWTTKVMNMPGMDYTIFEREGQAQGVGGGMQSPPDSPVPPNWLPYFAVSDCDGSAALATNLGATVVMKPTDIPGTGRFAVLQDPAGAAFAILKTVPMP